MGDTPSFGGVFAIPVTPFAPDGTIDVADLARETEFCIESGVHGLVYPAVVSEFFTLTTEERMRALEVVHGTAGGAVPIVAGVAATSTQEASALSGHAAALGCAAVMAMPPYVQHFFPMSTASVVEYFRRIADSGGLPVIAQNARIGHSLSLPDLVTLADEVPQVRWLKQEVGVPTHAVSAAIDALSDRVDGVFAGLGGIYLVNELDRGAVGTMPAPPFADVLSAAYADYRNDRRGMAVDRLAQLGPLFTYELLYNVEFIKAILMRRGVISSTMSRAPLPGMDEADMRTVDELLARVDLLEVATT